MKYSICLFFSLFIALASYAISDINPQPIDLQYHIITPNTGKSVLRPRTPACPPITYQYGHTILFGTTEFCNSVVLVDPCTEEVVYETQVDATESQITLPSFLEGEYEIRFMRDTYYYSGIIVL